MKKWKPNENRKREFAQTMREIDGFCREHHIVQSESGDSYRFYLRGTTYLVSNKKDGFEMLPSKCSHSGSSSTPVFCVFAGKTRIREIYNDILAGYAIDHKGKRINAS